MDCPPSLTFKPIRNGDTYVFPSYAQGICFLEGHPDPLHVSKIARNDQTRFIRVSTYRNGEESALFETEAPRDKSWTTKCSENTMSITHRDSKTGTAIFYENGSFRSENVTLKRDGTWDFIRAAGSDYFHCDEEEIISTNSTPTLLHLEFLPRCRSYYIRVVGQCIAICQDCDESSTFVTYELDNGAYRERDSASVPFKTITVTTLGANYILLLGDSELAVIECTRVEPVRFAFSPVPGNIQNMAARIFWDDSMEIYFSTSHEDRCRIYKASLSLQVLNASFESERIKKSNLDLSNRLRTAELVAGEQSRKRHAAQDREIAETKEKVAKLESTVVEENKKNAQLEETVVTLQSTVANLQESLKTMERKYTTVLLMAAKK